MAAPHHNNVCVLMKVTMDIDEIWETKFAKH